MLNIRIWTPESDFDSKVVTQIAKKIKHFYQYDIGIFQGSKKAYHDSLKRENGLTKQVSIYLKSSDLIIFLIDSDGVQASEQRKKEPNSMINKITELVNQFPDRVKLILMKQELEAWLLVDCLGICCYYMKNTEIRNNQDWIKFSSKYQKGNTKLITEAEQGGKGVKEYMIEFSEAILIKKNPNLKNKPRNLKKEKYSEQYSPEFIDYLEFNDTTIRRNPSLQEFSDLIRG
ncbi:MAG: hypothetical protein AB4041_05445 [Microcystaceae cyanobacterium]